MIRKRRTRIFERFVRQIASVCNQIVNRRILKKHRAVALGVVGVALFAGLLVVFSQGAKAQDDAMYILRQPADTQSGDIIDVAEASPQSVGATMFSSGAMTPAPEQTPELPGADGVITITLPPESTPEPTPTPSVTPSPSPSPSPTPAPTPSPSPTPKPVDLNKLVEEYMVTAKKYYNDQGFSSNQYNYTEDDVYILAQVICGEAHGESTEGKIAVGNVVLNRVLARGFPGKTIRDVITAPGQFSGYSKSKKPNSSCMAAARQVLEREVWVIPQNVYFFNSDRSPGENWGGHKYYTQIGGHCFYTENYSGRNRNGHIPPELFDRTFKWPQYGCSPSERVYRIQFMLNKLGYDVKADRYFGMTTKEALIAFQKDKRLKADGVAGPSTIKALIKAYGVEKYCDKFM